MWPAVSVRRVLELCKPNLFRQCSRLRVFPEQNMGFYVVKCILLVGLLSVVQPRPTYDGAVYFPKDDDVPHNFPIRPPGFEQSAASNTGSQTVVGKDGSVQQQTSGASQSANLAQDGSSGQLSATNTQQQSIRVGDKFQSQNQAQGQSASFGRDHQALSNTNTNTNTIRDGQSVREQTSGGAASSLQAKDANLASQAQTNSESFKEPGKEGSRTTGSAQSQNLGKDGTGSTSNANTGSEKIVLADGTVITKSFGSSSSFQTSGNKKASSSANTFSSSFGG
ncbi:protein rtoA-like [Anopheles cruzii]|uniref:protein rtoA-like n=1 Tax=Anopheles cruzii TaxID=68878 RepID=UPI0022EC51FD|nr:protein rtoA-like [Anopheles cruzii]